MVRSKPKPPNKVGGQTESRTVLLHEDDDIGAAYERLGAEVGFKPLHLSKSRIVVMAEMKEGKTTFVGSRPKSLHLDFDDAAQNLLGRRSHRIYVRTYKQLEEVAQQLEKDALRNARVYDNVAFDTVDWLQDLCTGKIEDENHGTAIENLRGGRGGYDLRNRRVLSFLRRVYLAGYGWSAVMQLKRDQDVDDKGKEISTVRPACSPAIRTGIMRDADYLFQLGADVQWQEEPDPRNPKMKVRKPHRTVFLETRELEGKGYNVELGTRIPLPQIIEIPKIHGFDAVEAAWVESVAQLEAEDRALRGK